jgi:HJR/Mrr/RecB family endonuclease
MDDSDLPDLEETIDKLTAHLASNPNRAIHPLYVEEIQSSPEEFGNTFSTLRRRVIQAHKPTRVTEHAKIVCDDPELRKERVGYLTLLAQEVAILGHTESSLIDVATDILTMIMSSVAETRGQRLQLAITRSFVARTAGVAGHYEHALACYLKALDIYIVEGQWQAVADLYYRVGFVEAALGFKAGALGWLYLSADVDRTIGRNADATKTLTRARDIQYNFANFTAAGWAARHQLSIMQRIVGGVLQQSLIETEQESPRHFIQSTHVPGIGSVTAQGLAAGSRSQYSVKAQLDDCLEEAALQEWPVGVIAGEAVGLRIMQRILNEPALLDDLHPRALETLVCKLCEGFGAKAQVTPATRDGGFDVSAVFRLGDSDFRILIEAKRWKQERKVGLATVDRMLGVRHRLNPDKVCIVTTSTFSNVAKSVVAQLQTEIDLVDRGGLLDWIHRVLVPSGDKGLRLPGIRLQ